MRPFRTAILPFDDRTTVTDRVGAASPDDFAAIFKE
jgi:hypothetical protein